MMFLRDFCLLFLQNLCLFSVFVSIAQPQDKEPQRGDDYRQLHIGNLGHHKDYPQQECQAEVVGPGIEDSLELGILALAPAICLELQVSDADDDPVHHRCRRGDGNEVHEHMAGEHVVQEHHQQGNARGYQDAVHRHAAAGNRSEEPRRIIIRCQAVKHAAVAIDGGVVNGNGSRQHHEVQDMGCCRYAHIGKDLHEGAGFHAHLIPGPEGHEHRHSAHIEQQDAHNNPVDGLGDSAVRVVCLPGGDADQLNAPEGEHDHGEGQSQPPPAIGQKAPMRPEIGDIVREGSRATKEQVKPQHDHHHDGSNLDEGHPELHFAIHAHIDEVGHRNDDKAHQGADPLREIRQPEIHIDAHCRKLGHGHDDIIEPIIPPGHEARELAPILVGIIAEGAGHRLVHRHFPQHPHDEENHDAAQEIGQHHRRPRQGNCGGRAVEQPRADGAPQGDHLQVAVLQPPPHFRRLLFAHQFIPFLAQISKIKQLPQQYITSIDCKKSLPLWGRWQPKADG